MDRDNSNKRARSAFEDSATGDDRLTKQQKLYRPFDRTPYEIIKLIFEFVDNWIDISQVSKLWRTLCKGLDLKPHTVNSRMFAITKPLEFVKSGLAKSVTLPLLRTIPLGGDVVKKEHLFLTIKLDWKGLIQLSLIKNDPKPTEDKTPDPEWISNRLGWSPSPKKPFKLVRSVNSEEFSKIVHVLAEKISQRKSELYLTLSGEKFDDPKLLGLPKDDLLRRLIYAWEGDVVNYNGFSEFPHDEGDDELLCNELEQIWNCRKTVMYQLKFSNYFTRTELKELHMKMKQDWTCVLDLKKA